jgi:hypothetical protein
VAEPAIWHINVETLRDWLEERFRPAAYLARMEERRMAEVFEQEGPVRFTFANPTTQQKWEAYHRSGEAERVWLRAHPEFVVARQRLDERARRLTPAEVEAIMRDRTPEQRMHDRLGDVVDAGCERGLTPEEHREYGTLSDQLAQLEQRVDGLQVSAPPTQRQQQRRRA